MGDEYPPDSNRSAGHHEPRRLAESRSRPGSRNRSGTGPHLPEHYLALALPGSTTHPGGHAAIWPAHPPGEHYTMRNLVALFGFLMLLGSIPGGLQAAEDPAPITI